MLYSFRSNEFEIPQDWLSKQSLSLSVKICVVWGRWVESVSLGVICPLAAFGGQRRDADKSASLRDCRRLKNTWLVLVILSRTYLRDLRGKITFFLQLLNHSAQIKKIKRKKSIWTLSIFSIHFLNTNVIQFECSIFNLRKSLFLITNPILYLL